MAEALAIATTEEILKKLVSFIAEEINLAWGLKEDLENLKTKLTMIQAVLNDAERRQVGEESLRLWLKNLRSVAYDAEDVFDEFAFEILRRKLEIQNRMKNKVRNFFSISNPIAFRFKMAQKVKNVNTKLARVIKEAGDFGIDVTTVTSHGDTTTYHGEDRQTEPFVDDSKVVGRGEDVEKVVNMLLNSGSDEDLSIIAIIGMAGLGKTTLAQLVYKNEAVMRHFSERSWVCVSDNFDIPRLLKEIVESFTGGSCEVSNTEAIIQKLKEKLNGKQFLLVLDDLWNTEAEKWDRMRNCLLGIGTRGSKIIVTTRSDEVVSAMQTILTHRLIGLSDDESWNLFKQKAFTAGGAEETQNLVKVGKRIVKKCGGVPLAIKSLGALMYSKEEEHEWLSIQNNEIWDFPEDGNRILRVLELSFDHLRLPYLKQCFTYCAIFPKDSTIIKEDLIQLWMAQGFLQASKGQNLEELEDVGHRYFKTLLWNSFFQDVEMDIYGNITTCKMHDLVHDLAQFMSGSQYLTLNPGNVNDDFEAQHLLSIDNEEIISAIPRERVRKMRTLILRVNDGRYRPLLNIECNCVLNFKCIRVLNLSESGIWELPTSIGKLKHLRYLNVSGTYITAFPKSIGKLHNLQTLRCERCYGSLKLPNSLKYLIGLRHLYFDYGHFDDWSIRSQLPIGIGQLTCLQTLPFFCVGQESGRRIDELGSLSKLRGELKICNLELVKDKEEAKKANLLGKTGIYKLEFRWSSMRRGDHIKDEDVLEGLEPQSHMKSLKIENFGGNKFPSWMMRRASVESITCLTSLESLDVKFCFNLIAAPEGLRELRSLRHLSIKNCGELKCFPEGIHWLTRLQYLTMGPFWEELDSFPGFEDIQQHHLASLRQLSLYGWPKLKSLPHQLQHLTALTHLNLHGFHGVEALPEWLGSLSSLRSLRIASCKNLMYLPSAEAMGRLTNLQILRIYECPLLKERCAKRRGPEWFKISHIPEIMMGLLFIRSQAD